MATIAQMRPASLQPSVHTFDVAIVGGGIVGLTLACALRDSGLSAVVIEAQTPAQTAARQRAYAFSPMSARIFQSLGLWEQVEPKITHFQRVRMSDADCPQVVNFRTQDVPTTPGGAVYYGAEHPVLMQALQAGLRQANAIDCWYETRLQHIQTGAETAELVVERAGQLQRIRAQLLVGADGARSQVRAHGNIETLGWQYWQSCITTVLQPEKSHQNTAYEKFWPSGPFAILPISNNRCQIVWTVPHAEAKALLALPREQFMTELKRRYGSEMGDITMLSEPLMFPVRLMQSQAYVRPRLALIGDAAHCCHPVGGQGLNMGIRDAMALAQVLKRSSGRDLGDLKLLKRYERWRRTENWIILGLTDTLNRTFSNQIWLLQGLRRSGFWLMDHAPWLKRLALRIMTGFFGRYPVR
ncbi:MAG: FAD-dependent hydroxylase [Leptolyngbya sp. SIO4C1]|nr:FAD-dependent hydroxylase [Leptolyngbya sp. SIO4C1]